MGLCISKNNNKEKKKNVKELEVYERMWSGDNKNFIDFYNDVLLNNVKDYKDEEVANYNKSLSVLITSKKIRVKKRRKTTNIPNTISSIINKDEGMIHLNRACQDLKPNKVHKVLRSCHFITLPIIKEVANTYEEEEITKNKCSPLIKKQDNLFFPAGGHKNKKLIENTVYKNYKNKEFNIEKILDSESSFTLDESAEESLGPMSYESQKF